MVEAVTIIEQLSARIATLENVIVAQNEKIEKFESGNPVSDGSNAQCKPEEGKTKNEIVKSEKDRTLRILQGEIKGKIKENNIESDEGSSDDGININAIKKKMTKKQRVQCNSRVSSRMKQAGSTFPDDDLDVKSSSGNESLIAIGQTPQCSKCQKKFSTICNLNRHTKQICGGEPKPLHPCRLCKKVFANGDYLKKHVKRTHIKRLQCRDAGVKSSGLQQGIQIPEMDLAGTFKETPLCKITKCQCTSDITCAECLGLGICAVWIKSVEEDIGNQNETIPQQNDRLHNLETSCSSSSGGESRHASSSATSGKQKSKVRDATKANKKLIKIEEDKEPQFKVMTEQLRSRHQVGFNLGVDELSEEEMSLNDTICEQKLAIMDALQCSKCQKKFSSIYSLNRHTKLICGGGPKSLHPCRLCEKVFANGNYLKNHVKRTHIKRLQRREEGVKASGLQHARTSQFGTKIEDSANENSCEFRKYTCRICWKCFTSEQDFKKHCEAIHGEDDDAVNTTFNQEKYELEETNRVRELKAIYNAYEQDLNQKTNFKCTSGCNDSFAKIKTYRKHLQEVHGKEMKKSAYKFSTCEEFKLWKDDLQNKYGISYSIKKRRKIGEKLIMQYICGRSGTYKAKGIGKRRLKRQKSCKIGFMCTSTIEVCIKDEYEVIHHEEHIGHEVDRKSLAHCTLTQTTKHFVRDKLVNKVNKHDIIKMVRENSAANERSSLITYQDILNIESQFNLENY